MVIADLHNSEPPPAEKPHEDYDRLLLDLSNFNREAVEIAREAEALRPQSEAISKHAELLEKLLEAGPEHLSAEQREIYKKAVAEFEAFINRHFKPQYERLLTRVAEQSKREASLKLKAKQLGVAVDFHSLPSLGNN